MKIIPGKIYLVIDIENDVFPCIACKGKKSLHSSAVAAIPIRMQPLRDADAGWHVLNNGEALSPNKPRILQELTIHAEVVLGTNMKSVVVQL